jgi:LacI family transcriptional regulator
MARPRPTCPDPDSARILIATRSASEYQRDIVRGALDYAQTRTHWRMSHVTRECDLGDPAGLSGADGALVTEVAHPESPVNTAVPVVLVASDAPKTRLPIVRPDNQALAAKALEELLALGYRRFAFLGNDRWYSRIRCRSLKRECRARQLPFTRMSSRRDGAHLAEVLARMTRPLAVITSPMHLATALIAVADQAGIAVPEEMAVLAIGDDDITASLCHPTISALDHNGYAVGYQAAAVLHRMLRGRRPRRKIWRVACGQVNHRGSTRAYAFDDPQLVDALTCIRERACEGIGVEDVMEELTISRRTLEMRFREQFGRSIHQEILRVRFDRVKRLLTETLDPLADIAAATGFQSASDLCNIFRRRFEMTPGEYRKRHCPLATRRTLR